MTRSELRAQGLSDNAIRARVASGRLQRLRPGWYAIPDANAHAVRAVRAGGSLTCISALKDFWTPPNSALHVRLPSNSRRSVVAGRSLKPHYLGRRAGTPICALDPTHVALAAAANCLPKAEWVAVADSILRAGYHPDELLVNMREAAPHLNNVLRLLMSRTSLRSESGSESLLRHDLQRAGFRVRAQVQIGVDRVDLLVGDRLIIECDSVAHHTGLDNYSADRLRDQRLQALGYHVLRVTYHHVVFDRPRIVALVRELARQGVHRSGRVHRVECP